MPKTNLRETIKETIRYHLKKNNGLVMGQCLTAVGWVGGTLPELYEKDGRDDVNHPMHGFFTGLAFKNEQVSNNNSE